MTAIWTKTEQSDVPPDAMEVQDESLANFQWLKHGNDVAPKVQADPDSDLDTGAPDVQAGQINDATEVQAGDLDAGSPDVQAGEAQPPLMSRWRVLPDDQAESGSNPDEENMEADVKGEEEEEDHGHDDDDAPDGDAVAVKPEIQAEMGPFGADDHDADSSTGNSAGMPGWARHGQAGKMDQPKYGTAWQSRQQILQEALQGDASRRA